VHMEEDGGVLDATICDKEKSVAAYLGPPKYDNIAKKANVSLTLRPLKASSTLSQICSLAPERSLSKI
jgi:hypothetical protein